MDKKKYTIKEHLLELRTRVFFCLIFFFVIFVTCYYFSENIYNFLLKPLEELVKDQPDFSLIYTGLTEAFFVYLRVAFLAAILFSTPIFIWQFYMFVAPALYSREKYVLLPFFVATPTLFLLGASIVYYYIFPLAWKFFIGFEHDGSKTGTLAIEFMPSVAEYLDLVVQLMFAFGIAFQLPVGLTLMSCLGLINYKTLQKKRKIAIVLIFIAAAVLTPPDVLSQIGLAIPMLILYEASIFTCQYIEKKKKKKSDSHATNL